MPACGTPTIHHLERRRHRAGAAGQPGDGAPGRVGRAGGQPPTDTHTTALLAHEVGRRAAAIRVLTEAIHLFHERGGDPQPLVQRLQGEVDDLDALVRAFLDGNGAAAKPADLVRAARAAARTVATARAAKVVCDLPTTPVWVRSHATMLRQAVENLLDNAARYAGDDPVELSVRLAGDQVEVVVADRGAGLGGEPDHPHRGRGLGLVLVRRVAEDGGGRLWSENRPGGGARFGLRLPVGVRG